MASSRRLSSMILGMTSRSSTSNDSGSRKNWVTLISKSRKSSCASRPSGRSTRVAEVGGSRIDLHELHSPLNAAYQGLLLVLAKIVSGPVVQKRADLRHVVRHVLARAIRRLPLFYLVE